MFLVHFQEIKSIYSVTNLEKATFFFEIDRLYYLSILVKMEKAMEFELYLMTCLINNL